MHWRFLFVGLVLLAAVNALPAQDACPVEGAWQLESFIMDGEEYPLGAYVQVKVLTGSHFAWQGVPQAGDTEGSFMNLRYGGGTYRVTETDYTESLDYFMDPNLVGTEVTFSCRVEGDQWYHDGEIPRIDDGQETGSWKVQEVWRRIQIE